MSSDSSAQYEQLMARLHEKADQYAEEADRLHDEMRELATLVGACNDHAAALRQASALIEGRIGAALEIDKKAQLLADAAAEKASQSAYGATQQALLDMLKRITAVSAQADQACARAGRAVLLSKVWAVAAVVAALLGSGAGAWFMHRSDAERFITPEQARLVQRGEQFEALLARASEREKAELQKIAKREQRR